MSLTGKTILVTDAGRGSAIAIIRSLGSRGTRVIAADADEKCAGFSSRYAAERLVYPRPAESPARFIDVLHSAARERGIDLIIPVTDEVVHPLAHARERFAGVCALAIAPSELTFNFEHTYRCGNEEANVGNIVIRAGGYEVTAEGVFTYKVNDDGKIAALRAYWEIDRATASARKM